MRDLINQPGELIGVHPSVANVTQSLSWELGGGRNKGRGGNTVIWPSIHVLLGLE